MTRRTLVCLGVVLALLFGSTLSVGKRKNKGKGNQEAAVDMTVRRILYNDNPTCEKSMTTNHFTLPDGASSLPIVLDYSGCPALPPGPLKSQLYMGYVTTNTSSTQFTATTGVTMTVTNNDTTTTGSSPTGWVTINPVGGDIPEPPGSSVTMFVTNNSGGDIKVRLRGFAYFVTETGG